MKWIVWSALAGTVAACASTQPDPGLPTSGHPQARFIGQASAEIINKIGAGCIERGFLIHRLADSVSCQTGEVDRTFVGEFRATSPGTDSYQLGQLVFDFTAVQVGSDVLVQEQTTFMMRNMMNGRAMGGNGNSRGFRRYNTRVLDYLISLGGKPD